MKGTFILSLQFYNDKEVTTHLEINTVPHYPKSAVIVKRLDYERGTAFVVVQPILL